MEELLQHCMRELAFDGDLGCDVSRLRHFVEGFYTSQHPPGIQKVDDAFHSFVWTLLTQQPSVRVGLSPQGGALEVYIAPQPSKRESVAKSKKKRTAPEPAPFPALGGQDVTLDQNPEHFPGRLQPVPEATTSSLENLIRQYGSSLRVAVDPETSFQALTGSHIRSAKLSPMVYTALQLISRGREAGLSVIDIGKKTRYDQKTCFYLVKQLLSLDLIVKLSKGGLGGGNFCVHKYFYARSSFWQSVRREEHAGEESSDDGLMKEIAESGPSGGLRPKPLFEPIDSRHLASTQLIKSRIVKLLKNSENGLHYYQNLLVTLGFANPTRSDRRCFILRVRELIKEGVIEKVIVPKMRGSSRALCIRLVEDARKSDGDGIMVQPGDMGDEEQESEALEEKSQTTTSMPIMNMTIHRQILSLLEQAGPEGLTLKDISARLGMFDKRTIELLLYRLERVPPPPHLADLAACDFIENHGRERRHRYFTLTGYLSFIHNENIDDAGHTTRYTSIDTSQAGGFYPQEDRLFYGDEAALIKFEDEYRDKRKPLKEGSTRKIGRPKKDARQSTERLSVSVAGVAPKPRGRPRKNVTIQEDMGEKPSAKKTSHKGNKRKRTDDAEKEPADMQPPTKKKRRRGKSMSASREDRSLTDHMDVEKDSTLQPQTEGMLNEIPLFEVARSETVGITGSIPGAAPVAEQTKLNRVVPEGHSDDYLPKSIFSTPGGGPSAEEVPAPQESVPNGNNEDFGRGAVTGTKRKGAVILSGLNGQEVKRPRTGRPKRTHELVNISQLRAENEIMRVVNESGGIANLSSKEFLETYTRIVASMAEAGEPTSMPVGTQPDRRTLRKILDKLVDRERLKTLTITITPRVTQPRLAKLIYEPSMPQEKIDRYLSSLREDVPVSAAPTHKKLDQPVHYTHARSRPIRDINFCCDDASDHRDTKTLGLNAEDNATRSIFLSQAETVAQLYGYLVGRARRARELHQFTLAHLQYPELSPHVVSRNERVVAFSYYFHDLPVSTYMAIVSVLEYNPNLSKLMQTPDGRQTPVKDLPLILSDELKIGRARARAKVLSLFEILVALKLVTPLQPSTSAAPYLTCEPNGTHPIHFDVAPTVWDGRTIAMSDSYWRFNTIAPVYLYSQVKSWPPPFHRDMFVRTADESMPFWLEVEDISLKREGITPETSMDSITGPCTCTSRVIRMLRKRRSWMSTYVLSQSQRQYLRNNWTDPSTGYTPLTDEDGGQSRIERICAIVSAPFDTVHSFFVTMHSIFTKQIKMVQTEDNPLWREEWKRQATEDRALLAKKAAEAKRQMEADWDALVAQVHLPPLPHGSVTRLKELRMRYLQSRARMSKKQWERQVADTIAGLKSGKQAPVLPPSASSCRKLPSHGISKLCPVASDQQMSVTELISQYKDKTATVQGASQKKVADGGLSTTPDHSRRQRFQWTPEYDELARDASAIIRTRCRTWHRMDWSALDQLFPFLPRNGVRQRISTLAQEAGGESYLRLLEDKWHELWLDHHGTDLLPDDNPGDPSDFDAIAHVEFLRKYIDKRALRVGLSSVDVHHPSGAVLAENVSDFIANWELEELCQPTNKLDLMWSSVGDEHREKILLGEAFSITKHELPELPSTDCHLNGVAESALKMALTTPDKDYDANDAATLLDRVGQEEIRFASENLLARGVISPTGDSHRKRPGRKLKISDLNEEALGGSYRHDFFVEACAVEDALEDEADQWKEWSPVATNGETATLIDLVSEGKIDFTIDISEPAAHRPELDWNSKKVDDDQIETALRVCYRPATAQSESTSESRSDSPMAVQMGDKLEEGSAEHGLGNGMPAPCRFSSQGIITCLACIDIEQERLLAGLALEERHTCLDLLERLNRAGRQGLSYDSFSTDPPSLHIIHLLTFTKDALCHWVGYDHPVLVSRRHISSWLVSIPGERLRMEFPRRWLDIKGCTVGEVWNAGLRAVAGILVARPGISQTELRKKLVSVYDRQEVNDLLAHLLAEEMALKQVTPENAELGLWDVRGIGGVQEGKVHWSLSAGKDAWYRVND